MNAQPHGAGGEQDSPLPETTLLSTREAGPDEAAEPTPVTSPVSTPRTMPVGSAYDERPAQHAAPGLEFLAQATGIPAGGWGAPAAMPRNGSATQSWTVKRGLTVAGAAVVLAAGTGVGVYALTSGTSSSAAADGTAGTAAGGLVGPDSPGSVPGGPGAQGGFAGGGGAPGQGGTGSFPPDGTAAIGGLSSAVHGEYVVLQGSDYVTKAAQLGTVTEIGSGAVTVKSTDGFSRTYVLGTDVLVSNQQQRRQQAGSTGSQLSVADIVAGGTVRIVSAKNGTDYTAESVIVTTAGAGGAANGTGEAS